MKITTNQKDTVLRTIDDMFFRLSAKLLGRFFRGKNKLYFDISRNADPLHTLDGAYRYAFAMLYGKDKKPDKDIMQHLADMTGNYIEAERLKTNNRIVQSIASAVTTEDLVSKLSKEFERTLGYTEMLLTTEVRTAQAYAEKDGILQVSASIGVEDPVVYRTGVIDDKLCAVCTKLWHSDHNIRVPRVYKSSEIRDGYSTTRNPTPTWSPSHPHCRHVWSTLPPGYGFDETGRVIFVGLGYDEYKQQRGIS
jgi:hypothetical protein